MITSTTIPMFHNPLYHTHIAYGCVLEATSGWKHTHIAGDYVTTMQTNTDKHVHKLLLTKRYRRVGE